MNNIQQIGDFNLEVCDFSNLSSNYDSDFPNRWPDDSIIKTTQIKFIPPYIYFQNETWTDIVKIGLSTSIQ
jgi:hypothetical protein